MVETTNAGYPSEALVVTADPARTFANSSKNPFSITDRYL